MVAIGLKYPMSKDRLTNKPMFLNTYYDFFISHSNPLAFKYLFIESDEVSKNPCMYFTRKLP